MFRSSADRLRAWLTGAGDQLWCAHEPAEDEASPLGTPWPESFDRGFDSSDAAPDDAACDPPHPHRRPLRWERSRRPGAVPARPAHCISPVRHKPAARPIPLT